MGCLPYNHHLKSTKIKHSFIFKALELVFLTGMRVLFEKQNYFSIFKLTFLLYGIYPHLCQEREKSSVKKKLRAIFWRFLYIYIRFTEGTKAPSPGIRPHLGRTEAPTDMVGVPTNQAWPEDHAGAIKNPEFRIRTELEPENRFSRFAPLWLNRGTYRHLQGTCGSGLT